MHIILSLFTSIFLLLGSGLAFAKIHACKNINDGSVEYSYNNCNSSLQQELSLINLSENDAGLDTDRVRKDVRKHKHRAKHRAKHKAEVKQKRMMKKEARKAKREEVKSKRQAKRAEKKQVREQKKSARKQKKCQMLAGRIDKLSDKLKSGVGVKRQAAIKGKLGDMRSRYRAKCK